MNKGILLTLVLLITSLTQAFGQQSNAADWTYPSYPELPFQLDHMEMELTLDMDTPLLKGAGSFELTSKQPDLGRILFNTSDLDVKGVTSEGNDIAYKVSGDSLILELSETLQSGDKLQLSLTWESTSPYGILSDVHGHVWTSLNPKALRHWIPLPDHPELSSSLNISVTLPAALEVVSNGKLSTDEIASTDTKTVQWSSEEPIPLTGLSLAAGPFRKLSARSGIKEVAIYAADDVLLEEVQSALLSLAVKSLKQYESELSFEYPYESLNIVVLPDARWEEKQAGAGVIYLYQNLGALTTQLRRAIAGQWFGSYHRYLDLMDHRIEFLKLLVTGTEDTGRLKNPNSLRSIEHWNFWIQGMDQLDQPFMKTTMKETLPEILSELKGVTGWDEYADLWYDRSGSYWDELPAPKGTSEMNGSSEYIYEVEYQFDESNAVLILNFEALGEPVETLVGLEVSEFGFTDTTRTEISFTGASDMVTLNVDPSVDYVTLTPVSEMGVQLTEVKPFMFLIRQLRSSEKELRLQAIYGLQRYTDNPDLQLALQDVLREEQDAEVKAAITQTLSQITQGASGTEETFLENIRSDDPGIKLAGLKALASYPEDERVRNAVRNVMLRAESDTVFNTALATYSKLSGSEELLALAERLNREEPRKLEVLQVLKEVIPADSTGKALAMTSDFLSNTHPYEVRKEAFDLLMEYEPGENVWAEILPALLNDRDPRIRYHALDAIRKVSAKKTVELLVDRNKEEMDPRVRARLDRILSRVNSY